MNKVTFDDIGLKQISLENLTRLGRLRDLNFNTRPEVCVELEAQAYPCKQRADHP